MTDTDLLGPGSGDEPMTVKLSEIENAPDRIVGKAVASDIRAAITAHVDPT